jgi:hypothetical protein
MTKDGFAEFILKIYNKIYCKCFANNRSCEDFEGIIS